MKLYCFTGDTLDKISEEIVEAHYTCPDDYKAQYNYYPPESMPEEYAKRRQEFGKRLFTGMGIRREDTEARLRFHARN
jgi:hypothetical protein